jgi:ABC-type molybdate transport system ATPase subunit
MFFLKKESVVAIKAVKRALSYRSVRFYLSVIVIFTKMSDKPYVYATHSTLHVLRVAHPLFVMRDNFYQARGEMYHHRVASKVIMFSLFSSLWTSRLIWASRTNHVRVAHTVAKSSRDIWCNEKRPTSKMKKTMTP